MEKLSSNTVLTHNEIKAGLLSGNIRLEDARLIILDIDQRSPEHIDAYENLKLLLDPEIVDLINTIDESRKQYYYRLLSLTEFHVAQIEVLVKGDVSRSLEHFRNAYSVSLKYDAVEWTSYIDATILYLEGKEIPEILIQNCNDKNKQILIRMNAGLKKRGFPLYTEDYLNTYAS